MSLISCSRGSAVAFASLAVFLIVLTTSAQAPTARPGMLLTAAPANAAQAADRVKIDIAKWSTADEQKALVAATKDPVAAAATASRETGFAFGGVAGAAGAVAVPAGAGAATPAAAAPAAAAAGAQAPAAAPATPPPPFDPVKSLVTALEKGPTVGMLWTSETIGYSIKYANRTTMPDGTERIVLATNRRLGLLGPAPRNAGKDPEYTIIEIRLDAKGAGEAKASFNAVDAGSGALAVANYPAATSILKNIKK